jgi:hypothetical protein
MALKYTFIHDTQQDAENKEYIWVNIIHHNPYFVWSWNWIYKISEENENHTKPLLNWNRWS